MHRDNTPRTNLARRAGLRTTLATLSAMVVVGSHGAARAQVAARGLRILCASPPGGTPDVIARHYAARLGGLPGGAMVENRHGAAGLIAVAALLQSAPDGSTALLGHSGLVTMYPYLYRRLAYDPALDLVPVAAAAETAFAVAVGPAVPAEVRELADYIRWAQADPSRATYGTPGNGTLTHLLGAMLARDAGFEAQHVAYVGGPQAITDLIGGRLSSVVLPEGLLRPLHLAGKLRVLATSGPTRGSVLPTVPTLVDSGYKSLVLREWFGFYVPRGTPAAAVDTVAMAVRAAATAPELVAALQASGMQALAGTTTQMQERILRERAFWREAIPPLGIRMD